MHRRGGHSASGRMGLQLQHQWSIYQLQVWAKTRQGKCPWAPSSTTASLPPSQKTMTRCRWSAAPSAAWHQWEVWQPPLSPPLDTAPEYFTAVNCCQDLGKELQGFFSFSSPCELSTVKADCLRTLGCRHSTSKMGNLSPKERNSVSTH